MKMIKTIRIMIIGGIMTVISAMFLSCDVTSCETDYTNCSSSYPYTCTASDYCYSSMDACESSDACN